jgi:glycosyltransferase involved in cell wall biosynthesis
LNAERYLAEAMRSVLGQDCPDLEYLLVDGGSSDRTQEIIRDFADDDCRVKWLVEPKPGIAHAMNRGIQMAKGDLIAFLHADDRYHGMTTLARVSALFQNRPDALWVTGGLREIDADGAKIRDLPARRFTKSRLLRNNIIYHPATFIRSVAIRDVGGFDEGLRYAMDYDLWLRLAEISAPCICHEPLAEFRVHAGSLSSAQRDKAMQEEYLVRQRYLGRGPVRLSHACYQWLRLHCQKWRSG